MLKRPISLAVLAVLLGLLPASAFALGSVDERGEEAAPAARGFPLSGSATLENTVGLGSFVENPDTGQMKMPYYALLLTLRGKWRLADKLALAARFDLEKEVTSSYTSTSTLRHQLSPGDLQLTLQHSDLFTDEWLTGLRVDGDLRLYFPTSYTSRYATRLLGLSARLGLNRKLGGFQFAAGSRVVRYVSRYTQAVVPEYEEHPGDLPCSGLAVDGGTICGGRATTHTTLIHDFTLGYDFTDRISAGLYLFVINHFSYAEEPDALSSPYASGENQRDLTWGVVDLSYQMREWLGYSIGVSSYQPAKTEDGARLRFPFWDLEGRAENYVTFYFDVTGSF